VKCRLKYILFDGYNYYRLSFCTNAGLAAYHLLYFYQNIISGLFSGL